jgi:hypothetical protein
MRRKFLNVAATVSLVLCVATVVLWVRSYCVSETVWHDDGLRSYEVRTGRGSISFSCLSHDRFHPPWQKWMYNRRAPAYPSLIADPTYWHISFSLEHARFSGIIVPYPVPTLLLAIAPLWQLMYWRRSRRRKLMG